MRHPLYWVHFYDQIDAWLASPEGQQAMERFQKPAFDLEEVRAAGEKFSSPTS